MTLRLTDTMTGKPYDLNFEDTGISGQYWNAAVDIPEGMADGEYSCVLLDGDVVLASGLAMKGRVKQSMNDSSVYESGGGFRQYNG